MLLPTATGSGVSVLVMDKSAIAVTAVVAVAELLPATGSLVVDDTVAVSLMEAAAEPVTVTTMVTVTLAPLLIVPRLQVTMPAACEQVPVGALDGVADTNVTPAGSVSVSVAAAAEGPALETVTV
jgi:hypothetical protein